MKRFEIEETCGGFCIRATDKYVRPVYVMSVYKGAYKWTTDYMYSRRFCRKTAEKHLEILRRIEK